MRDETVARLWALAAGRCSMCKTQLFVDVEEVKIGEMAHIIARRQGGPRGSIAAAGDINGYDNLILLCPNDHSLVDRAPELYPPERLLEAKRMHERWVRTSLQNSPVRSQDVAGLQSLMRFLNFTLIPGIIARLPYTLDLHLLEVVSAIEAFPLDNPQCAPFTDAGLERRYQQFADAVLLLWSETQGADFGPHIYVYPDTHDAGVIQVLNRDLEHKEKARIRQNIDVAIGGLAPAYSELMSYLRASYPEVILAPSRR